MNHTLQISDTAALNEASVLDGIMKSKGAMNKLSAFIIVLNYRALKDQGENRPADTPSRSPFSGTGG